jgi:hypothetical protein
MTTETESQSPAAITIDENSVAIWYIHLDENTDWLAGLSLKGAELELLYRFRYYDANDPDNEPFSGKDRKSWTRVTIKETKEEALNKIREIVCKLEQASGKKADELLMRDGPHRVERFANALSRFRWAHAKRI